MAILNGPAEQASTGINVGARSSDTEIRLVPAVLPLAEAFMLWGSLGV